MLNLWPDSAVVMLVRVEKGTRDGEMGRRIGNGTGGRGGGWEEGVVGGALKSGEWESGEWGVGSGEWRVGKGQTGGSRGRLQL